MSGCELLSDELVVSEWGTLSDGDINVPNVPLAVGAPWKLLSLCPALVGDAECSGLPRGRCMSLLVSGEGNVEMLSAVAISSVYRLPLGVPG